MKFECQCSQYLELNPTCGSTMWNRARFSSRNYPWNVQNMANMMYKDFKKWTEMGRGAHSKFHYVDPPLTVTVCSSDK